MKYIVPLFAIVMHFSSLANNLWSVAPRESYSHLNQQIQANNSQQFLVDFEGLKELLNSAASYQIGAAELGIRVELPLPDGQFVPVQVWNAPIMQQELGTKFPGMQTFVVKALDGNSLYGRLDYTQKGFHAMLFTDKGTLFIDPYSASNTDIYISYFKHDFIADEPTHVCLAEEENDGHDVLNFENHEKFGTSASHARGGFPSSNGGTLRTYRLAVSATAEYTMFHGGTVADGLAAVVTTVNRVTGVYERDLTITFILIDNNDQIIYTNAATDPFTDPSSAGQLINQNQTSINSTIGSANYDIGHVVGTDGSGLASFGVVCRNNSKARGTTGRSNPIGDPFDIDYVAHEIGHQFGGSHTFNALTGSCNGNRSGSNAYEPGSGTSIMAYAGICGADNVANNSDDMFHTNSFDQMVFYSTLDDGDNCPAKTPTNNAIPVITATTGDGLTIPISTPFELTATASDANGDALTYSWEQHDLGPAGGANSPTGNAPLFRTFPPTTSPTRSFPRLSNVLSNTQTIGEILPDYDRNMQFRAVVRDNVAGGGATIYAEVNMSVTSSAGPFLVTNPNTSMVNWQAAATETVTWDVANTNMAPVNCATVNILLSIDGGQTYPFVLATNVTNNGTAAVAVPNVASSQARIRIECATNVFYDISNADFDIEVDCGAINTVINMEDQSEDGNFCAGDEIMLFVDATTPTLALAYQWKFNNANIPGATSDSYVISNAQIADGGNYSCEITNGCETLTSNNMFIVVSQSPNTPMVLLNGQGQLVSTNGGTNEWYLDGNIIPGETGIVLNPSQPGSYSVAAVLNGCKSLVSDLFVFTAIQDFNTVTEILIHPNPSNQQIIVSVAGWDDLVSLKLMNSLGQLVYQESFTQASSIDILKFSSGVYFVQLESAGFRSTHKLIKQ